MNDIFTITNTLSPIINNIPTSNVQRIICKVTLIKQCKFWYYNIGMIVRISPFLINNRYGQCPTSRKRKPSEREQIVGSRSSGICESRSRHRLTALTQSYPPQLSDTHVTSSTGATTWSKVWLMPIMVCSRFTSHRIKCNTPTEFVKGTWQMAQDETAQDEITHYYYL